MLTSEIWQGWGGIAGGHFRFFHCLFCLKRKDLYFFSFLLTLQQSLIYMLFKTVNLNWQIISAVSIGLDKSISVFSCLQLNSSEIIAEIRFILSSKSHFFLSKCSIKLYLWNYNLELIIMITLSTFVFFLPFYCDSNKS